MAVEPRRGCGYRKVGGLYLRGSGIGRDCGRLSIPLITCPCCGIGIRQNRGWNWVNPEVLFRDLPPCTQGACGTCPLANLAALLGHRAGLLWIGAQFYPTPEHFVQEAHRQGISRRIAAVPKDFQVGETWVLLAHPLGARDAEGTPCPGVFYLFRPEAVEIIVTESQARDPAFMAGLQRRGLTPVVVPDDDPDHQPGATGSVTSLLDL